MCVRTLPLFVATATNAVPAKRKPIVPPSPVAVARLPAFRVFASTTIAPPERVAPEPTVVSILVPEAIVATPTPPEIPMIEIPKIVT